LPGQLTGKQLQKENIFSAATLVAYLAKPDFDGAITYDADDDGDQVGGLGSVEVFASGLRNPYGIVLHSNGYVSHSGRACLIFSNSIADMFSYLSVPHDVQLYATDNGPNYGYGNTLLSCAGDFIDDVEEEDKVVLVQKGSYYGHPNPKRGEDDSRQCTWHSASEPGGANHTAPLAIVPSSTDGIIEFKSDAFDRQMRGDLIGKSRWRWHSRRQLYQKEHSVISLSSVCNLYPQCRSTIASFIE